MIIDEEALENSDFTLMTKEEFNDYNDNSLEIVIKKYNLIKTEDVLTHSSETSYLALIQHIEHLYYKTIVVPDDIKELIQNHLYFKAYLIQYLQKRLENLLQNGSALFFKELTTIINLLSRGNQYKIFKNYNTYDYDEISRLFRDYENCLLEKKRDKKEDFEVSLNAYTTLMNVYNKLCLVNATDIQRKKTILPITDLLTESINILKYTVSLSKENLSKLNNILGQILYYFSHLPFVNSAGKDVDYLIQQYYLLFEKISDGYYLSRDTNFGENPKAKDEEFLRFKNNSSFLLLIMLRKLHAGFSKEEYFICGSFKKCIMLYEKNFSTTFIKDGEITLDSFRDDLLDSLALTYITKDNNIGNITDYRTALSDFILESENYDIHNLETIHDILLLADNVEDYSYINIGETLLHSPLIKNDYYEFFKLKTLDIIINHFIKRRSKEDVVEFIEHIYTYIEKYKVASHLMPMFSKIYLSISHYYSTKEKPEYIQKARDIYAMFVNINGYTLLKNEYSFINRNLLIEFGRYHLKELNFTFGNYNKEELLSLGKIGSKNYLKYNDLKTKYTINQEIAKITEDILKDNTLNYEEINQKITALLTNEIFYGISEISIKGLTKRKSMIIDEGYKQHVIPIDQHYSIQFIFPAVYEYTFNYILKQNEEFITKNLTNILTSYKKESHAFIHEITGLENLHKFKQDLIEFEPQTISLLQIYIGAMSDINSKYGFEIGNKFLVSITNKILSIIDSYDSLYYLDEGKLGLIIHNKDDINKIVEKIFKFTIQRNKEKIDIDFTIAVAISDRNLFELSKNTLDNAIINNKNLLFNEQ